MKQSMTRRRFLALSGAAAGSLMGGLRLARGESAKPPSLVWILLDQCRADALACYGHPFVKTPNIDRLAARGVQFTNAFVTGMPCVPSRVCYHTGLYPHQTGAYNNNGAMRVADSNLTRLLKTGPVKELTMIGKSHLGVSPEAAGYGKYTDISQSDPVSQDREIVRVGKGSIHSAHSPQKSEEMYAGRCVTAAIDEYKRLRQSPSPFMICLSINRPHPQVVVPSPYYEMYEKNVTLPDDDPAQHDGKPEEIRVQFTREATSLTPEQKLRMIATYYGCVSHVDAELGRLFQAIEDDWRNGRVIVILNADHGTYLGNRGRYEKGFGFRDATQVPFLVSWPGHLPEGRKVDAFIESIDVLPTLLDVYAIPADVQLPGLSFMPLITGQAKSLIDTVFNEDERRKTVRTMDWHLSAHRLKSGEIWRELYDSKKDPGEKKNVAQDPANRQTLDRLQALIDKRLGTEFPATAPAKKRQSKTSSSQPARKVKKKNQAEKQ